MAHLWAKTGSGRINLRTQRISSPTSTTVGLTPLFFAVAGASTLSGSGSIAAVAISLSLATAAIPGSGAIVAAAIHFWPGSAIISGSGTIAATGTAVAALEFTDLLAHSYTSRLGLEVTLPHAYKSREFITKTFTHTYSTGPGTLLMLHTYRSTKVESTSFIQSYTTYNPPTFIPYVGHPPVSEWERAITEVGGDISGRFMVGSKSLGELPAAFTVNLNLSAPSTASIDVVDTFYKHHPEAPGDWHNILDEQPLTGTYQTPKQLRASITWGGRTFEYKFLGRAWNSSSNWLERRQQFQWGLSDHSLKWQSDYESQTTVRSNRDAIVTNADSIRELGRLYNVKTDLRGLSFTHPLPIQHRQSARPLDWVTDLVTETLQDDWTFVNGDTFTPFYPDPKFPKTTIDFSKHAMEEEASGEWSDIYNWVVLTRAVESGAHGGAIKVMEVDTFGQYTVVFDEPVFAPQWNIESASQGIFSDFLYKDAAGRVMQVQGARAPSSLAYGVAFTNGGPATAVKSITFTWGIPANIVGLLGAYGRIVFRATPYPDAEAWGGAQLDRVRGTVTDPLPLFRSEAKDLESIAKYGVRKIELSANPQIPTKQLADIIAQRILKKVSRRSRSGSVKIYLNPEIVPGLVVKELILPGFTRIRIVTSVEHRFSTDAGDRYTRYQGITYRGDTLD